MAGICIADMSELTLHCIHSHDLSVLYHCTVVAVVLWSVVCIFIEVHAVFLNITKKQTLEFMRNTKEHYKLFP